jgi:hypothetical protein
MKYVVEMGSGGVIYIPSFIKIGSAIRKSKGDWVGFVDAQTSWRSHKPTLGEWPKK